MTGGAETFQGGIPVNVKLRPPDSAPRQHRPWVIIAGGLDNQGAMDKANLALALYLARAGRQVHVVAHRAADDIRRLPGVRFHEVPRPLGSYLLGQWHLDRTGRRVARSISRHSSAPVVLSNGGNCTWPGVNWVHSVHHEWPTFDAGAPAWFKIKNRLAKSAARRSERLAFAAATLLLANSNRTKHDIIRNFPGTEDRVAVVYLGSDPEVRETTPTERRDAKESLGLAADIPVVLFVGALSHDNNKGLDVLMEAWRELSAETDWNARLLIAGGGGAVDSLRQQVASEPRLAMTATVLGYRKDVNRLYMAADLLVAPSRYEAYGLAAQEAICTGLPVLISGSAGIAERFPSGLNKMLLRSPPEASELVSRLREWRTDIERWRQEFRPFGTALRGFSWDDMAAEIVDIAERRA